MARRPILRRYLDVLCSRPAIDRSETPVLYFALLKLPNGDSLLRENHGRGFHFHYSDDGKRRADILLTFSRDRQVAKKPVTWEPHAIMKADFEARLPAWGSGKRESVHVACLYDLSKRRVTDYLRPGKNTQLLCRKRSLAAGRLPNSYSSPSPVEPRCAIYRREACRQSFRLHVDRFRSTQLRITMMG